MNEDEVSGPEWREYMTLRENARREHGYATWHLVWPARAYGFEDLWARRRSGIRTHNRSVLPGVWAATRRVRRAEKRKAQ